MNKNQKTLKQSIMTSPGPTTPKEGAFLFFKGVCMGTADIIPGVSGGTIALITGIYTDLLDAIKSVNINFIKNLARFNLKEAISIIHIRFLVALLSGIGLAIMSLSHLMNYLLKSHPVPTWSLFLGLIAASIIILAKKVEEWFWKTWLAFLIGTFLGYYIVGMIPVETPNTMLFIFFSGMIAICAMILPGISGAFLLLILGKYELIISCLKNPFVIDNLFVIFIFAGGCIVGITGFSRVMSFLLKNYYSVTISLLTGLMLGSMRKIWPWKITTETKEIAGKIYVISEKNILPQSIDKLVIFACILALIGFMLVFIIEKTANIKGIKK
ncbi:MAG: DUF368 domain-containing protein [Desulfobacterales bacterium]|nr:DUF368 domain-containing protein [Desulfobacterales bacterium]